MKQKYILIALSFAVISLQLNDSYSYPKFAAYTGEKCVTCHVNPTGGGIRNLYGVKYSRDELFMNFLKKANKDTEFDPRINKGIQVGSDMRMIFIDDQIAEGVPNFNTFFQMEGNLYIYGKMNRYLSLMVAPGLYIPNTFGPDPLPVKYEIFGMVSELPAGLYMKIGEFLPNFGIRIPEHRAYQRTYNDLYTPLASDAGIEVGIAPSFFTLTVALSNGTSTDVNGTRNNSYDFDNQKQFTTTADFRWQSKDSKYNFGFGGSFLTNPFKWDPVRNINALKQIAGGFFSVGLFERIAILGEFDYNRLELRDSVRTKREFQTIFGEVDIRVVQGLEAKFQFENYNPQLGIKYPPLELRRYSFGLEFYPMTGLEIETVVRYVQEPGKTRDPVTGQLNDVYIKNNEFQTMFKFYF